MGLCPGSRAFAAPNALTGKDVLERKLATVPLAARAGEADHAANADLLGGSGPSAFAAADRFVVARATAHWVSDGTESGERTEPLLTKGPFTLTLVCQYAANTQATVTATTTAADSSHTSVGAGTVFGPASGPVSLASATVASGGTGRATGGAPFSLLSKADGAYLAGHVTVFAEDANKECRAVLSGTSG